MNERVYIPEVGVTGIVVQLMAYGAIIKYTFAGIEFEEMLSEDDYELLTRGILDGFSIDE